MSFKDFSARTWAVLAFMIGLCLTYQLVRMAKIDTDQKKQDYYNIRVSVALDHIQQRLHAYQQVLQGVSGLFDAQNQVDRQAFKRYVAAQHLETQFPGIQGVGFSLIVPAADKERHIKSVQSEGFSNYTLKPDGVRDSYTAIIYLEPFSGRNLRAFGFDMFSEPVRHAAMQQALDEDRAVLSGKVRLVQEDGKQPSSGFLMYLPVYRQGVIHKSLSERRVSALGWVYAPFRMNDLMNQVLGENSADLDLEIYDGDKVSPDTLMYDSTYLHENKAVVANSSFQTLPLSIVGHTWTVRMRPLPSLYSSLDLRRPILLAVIGTVMSVLLACIVWLLLTCRERTMSMAKRISQSLVEEQERLVLATRTTQELLYSMAEAAYGVDDKGCCTFVNQALITLLGYDSPDELLGKPIHPLIHHSRADGTPYPAAECKMLQRREFNQPIVVADEVFWRRDGVAVPVEYRANPIIRDGIAMGVVATFVDITERLAVEQELRQHRDHLEQLVEQKSSDLQRMLSELQQQRTVIDEHAIVSISDVRGRITYANDKFCQISGYTREELIRQDHIILNSDVHPKGFFKDMWVTAARGGVWHGDVCNRAKSGKLYWVNSTVAAFMGPDDKPLEYFSVRTDITDRKRAEVAAQVAVVAKSHFLTNMSHEIRTPMNGVIGMLDILQQTVMTNDQQRIVSIVHTSALALLNILNDILDYSKIEAGKMSIESIPLSLPRIVEDIIQLMQIEADNKGVQLSAVIAPDLPEWIASDPTRLRQILLNLVGNAIKFTDGTQGRGKVTLTVESCVLKGGDTGLVLRIADNGIGMSEAVIDTLFTPFTQADSSTARKFGGSGLGLSIVKRLVTLMKGEVSVDSAQRVGSEFVVRLPLLASEPAEPMKRLASVYHDYDDKIIPTGLFVLLAEDNEINRRVMQEQLRLLGYNVDVAEDGVQALSMWRAGHYSLLLTDCHMPNMDGYELTMAIRSEEAAGRRLPIIAVTANAMDGAVERCLNSGMDAFMSKPLRLSELDETLKRWLQLAEPDYTRTQHSGESGESAIEKRLASESENLSLVQSNEVPPEEAEEEFAVWDAMSLTRMVGDNPALHRRLLTKFLQGADVQVSDLLAAIEAGDPAGVTGLAHKLKSGSRSVGAMQLGELCLSLEMAGRAEDIDKCRSFATALSAAYAACREMISLGLT